MTNAKCEVCGFRSQMLLGECYSCKQYFCNSGGPEKPSHLLYHIRDTRHLVFAFPGVGVPYCSVCYRKNLCGMFYSQEGEFFCKLHKNDDHAPIICNNIVNFLLPVPTYELMDQREQIQFLDNKNYAYAQIDMAESKLKATDGGYQLRLQQLNDSLLKIPACFPYHSYLVRCSGGVLLIKKHFSEEFESGQIYFYDNKYVCANARLRSKLYQFLSKDFTYADFFIKALKAEFLMQRSQIEETKEAIATSLVYFRTYDYEHYQAFFPWGKFKRLCNYQVRVGDELCLDIITSKCTVQVYGSVVRCGEHMVLRLDRPPISECLYTKMHDVNEIVFDSVYEAGRDVFSSFYANYNVFRAADNVTYLLKFSMKDLMLKAIILNVKDLARNINNFKSLEILKGNFPNCESNAGTGIVSNWNAYVAARSVKQATANPNAVSAASALLDASDDMCSAEKAGIIIEYLKTAIRERVQAGDELYEPNDHYVRAIRRALTSCISLIYGCPGGGKTYTAALVMKCLLCHYENQQVLCCAGSNVAADNLAIYALRLGIRTLRVYAKNKESFEIQNGLAEVRQCALHAILQEKVYANVYVDQGVIDQAQNDAIREYMITNVPFKYSTVNAAILKAYESLEGLELDAVEMIISTCTNSAHPRVRERSYAAVLIDETSQIVEPDTILPIMCAPRHFVLVGDQNYLGPTIANSKAAAVGLGRSLYTRLLQIGIPPVRLHRQYRMHPGLLEFPNDTFYLGRITSGISGSHRVLKPRNPAQNFLAHFLYPNFPSFFWHIDFRERYDEATKSYLNVKEADVVVALVRSFRNEYGLREYQIGVITPYSAQYLHILQLLEDSPDIEVNSVDGFQGREKDIIIFSCVRSNEEDQIGFLNDKRRVNVAMTRAKYAFVIVGNAAHLAYNKGTWTEVVKFYQNKTAIFVGSDLRALKPFAVPSEKKQKKYDQEGYDEVTPPGA